MRKALLKSALTLLCGLGTLAATASWHADYEAVMSKKFVGKRDMPHIDSLLNVIKAEAGTKCDEFINLGTLRVRKTIMGADTIHWIFDDLIEAAPSGRGNYENLKKAFTTIRVKYPERKVDTYRSAWLAELAHCTPADTVDEKILDMYLMQFPREQRYGIADTVIAAYAAEAGRRWGTASQAHARALEKRVRNFKSWRHSPGDADVIQVVLNTATAYDGLIKAYETIHGPNSPQVHDALAALGADMSNTYSFRDRLTKEQGAKMRAIATSALSRWVESKADNIDISDKKDQDAFKTLIITLRADSADIPASWKYTKQYIDLVGKCYGHESPEYCKELEADMMYCPDEEKGEYLDRLLPVAEKNYGPDSETYKRLLQLKSFRLLDQNDLGGAIEVLSRADDDPASSMLGQLNSRYGNVTDARRQREAALPVYAAQLDDPLAEMNFFSACMGTINDFQKFNQPDSALAFAARVAAMTAGYPATQRGVISAAACAVADNRAAEFVADQMSRYPALQTDSLAVELFYTMAECALRGGDPGAAAKNADLGASRDTSPRSRIRRESFAELQALYAEDLPTALRHNAMQQHLLALSGANPCESLALLAMEARVALALDSAGRATEAVKRIHACKDAPRAATQLYWGSTFSAWDSGSIHRLMSMSTGIDGNIFRELEAEAAYLDGDTVKTHEAILPMLEENQKLLYSSIETYATIGKADDLGDVANSLQAQAVKWASRLPDTRIQEIAADNLLASKQLSLNTAENIRRLAASSGNPGIAAKQAELQAVKDSITHSLAAGVPYAGLAERKRTLEIQIANDVKRYGDMTSGIKTSYQTIQQHMQPGDYAVEFSTYQDAGHPTCYTATVIPPQGSPRTISLFDQASVKTDPGIYRTTALGDRIWGPILQLMPDARRICFSPAGDLHLINIENLPYGDGLISERYDLCRLSSTRELANRRQASLKTALVYGGLDYDHVSDAAASAHSAPTTNLRDLDVEEFIASVNETTRGGAAYLPGTKAEADSVGHMLGQKMEVTILQGTDGSESSLKALSTHAPSILHIASHGYFWSRRAARRMGLKFLNVDPGNTRRLSEHDLSRSGLLFAGANLTLRGNNPNTHDDGILTAREISHLRLDGSELTVLSACQSALGEISGEGVFGLQRGFKMAGAKSLLMSLWQVDDEATRLLMTNLYHNLMLGHSPRKALAMAQDYLRGYEVEVEEDQPVSASQRRRMAREGETAHTPQKTRIRPYDAPKYWAAFIILDALD